MATGVVVSDGKDSSMVNLLPTKDMQQHSNMGVVYDRGEGVPTTIK